MQINSKKDLKYFIQADLASMGVKLNLKNFIFDPLLRFVLLSRYLEYAVNTHKSVLILFPLKFLYRRLSVRLCLNIMPQYFWSGFGDCSLWFTYN